MTGAASAALLSLPGHAAAAAAPARILDWLEQGARSHGRRPAIIGIDRPALDHAGLFAQVRATAETISALGIGRGDVVLVMIANGPEALCAILSVAATAVAVPVAVDEPRAALDALIARLPVRALLFDAAHGTAAQSLCSAHGLIPVALRFRRDAPAGCFEPVVPSGHGRAAVPTAVDDAAILARTAGTTAAPRLVAWSQASLHRSAAAAADWMGLTADDRSLCMMPFTHLHALVRSAMPGLLRGGAVICAPGFDRARALDWIATLRPTYMTAVPAIYRGLLAAADAELPFPRGALRFLASGSDGIDVATVAQLVQRIGVPVREFYGMSEVAPMLAATAAGVNARDGGAVGPPLPGWVLEMRAPDGRALPASEEGEIAARGGLFNPVLDADGAGRIVDGWYLTGDRGFIDAAGRVHVTGRVDERINRGGKKIAPEAVEAALKSHADVHDAVAVPVPDAQLGERLGALVVLAPGRVADERGLRAFVAERLPDYMVPDRILFAREVPRTALGKLGRRALAAQFTDAAPAAAAAGGSAPGGATETALLELACSLLNRDDVDAAAEFSALGCDSFFATTLLVAIEDRFGVLLTPGQYIEHGSVRRLAALIERRVAGAATELIELVQAGTGGTPLFFAHAPQGYAFYARPFARSLGPQQTVYAFQCVLPEGGDLPRMEDYAAQYVRAMRVLQPQGPYCLAGHSFGAQLAFEVARQLADAGEGVAFLALIDDEADLFKRKFGVARLPLAARTFLRCRRMLDSYAPGPYAGDIDLFMAEDAPVEQLADPSMGWAELCTGRVLITGVPGTHAGMMSGPVIERWSGLFADRLRRGLEDFDATDWKRRRERCAERCARTDIAAAHAARAAAKAGELDAEIAAYRRAIGHDAEQPYWVYRNLGNALLQRGERERGIECLRQGARREAVPVVGHTLLAGILHRIGRDDEARKVLQAAEQGAAGNAQALAHVAGGWLALGTAEPAERCARAALALNADHLPALGALARALERMDRMDEALALMRHATAIAPEHAGSLHRLGALLARRDDLAAAEAAQRRALAIEPFNVGVQRELAALLERQQRPDEALAVLRRLIEIAPGNAEVLHQLGALLRRRGEAAAAESALRQALALDGRLAPAWRELGGLLDRTGRTDEAIAALQAAVDADPRHVGTLHRIGVLLKKREQLAEAVEFQRRALKIEPDHVGALRELGIVLERLGSLDEAAACVGRLLELAPGADAHLRYGSLLRRLGRPDEAEAELRRALVLKPGIEGAERQLALLAQQAGRS